MVSSYPIQLTYIGGPTGLIASVGPLDYVLLSHDHHFDNLDHAGRSLLGNAKAVFTTVEGAGRLGGASVPLTPWQSLDLPTRRDCPAAF